MTPPEMPFRSGPPPGGRPFIGPIPSAALSDVLLEQIEYLLTHGRACEPDCSDCMRLEQVKRYLLRPFLSEPRLQTSVAAVV
jgi:hypothetical protein